MTVAADEGSAPRGGSLLLARAPCPVGVKELNTTERNTGARPNAGGGGILRGLRRFLLIKELAGVIMLLVVILIFYLLSSEFMSVDNLRVILQMLPELGILTIGVTLLMISGEFDLSVGSVFALAPVLNGLMLFSGWNPLVAFILPLIACIGIGALNGIVTTKLNIPSFITTLGSMMIWRGIVLVISGGFPFPWMDTARPFQRILVGDLGIMRVSMIWYAALVIVFWIMLERTRFGNWMFAVGGSTRAARALGIIPDRVKILNFIIVAFLAGIAGMIQYMRLEAPLPSAGTSLELDTIASSVIGGAALAGGAGSVIGSVLGSILIRIVDTGLILAGAPSYWFRVFVGLLLVVAVAFHRFVERTIDRVR
jgi:simple sugar transport system permease protein